MSYSFPWNNSVPAGSDPANQLDTFITDLKSAVSERMEDKIIQSMTADPWVVKPEILGNVTGKIYQFHWSDACLNPEFSSMTFTNKSFRNDDTGTNKTLRIPLHLPNGVTITEFRMFAAKGSNNVSAALTKGTYDTTFTETVIYTLTQTNATFGEVYNVGMGEVVDLATYVYFIEVVVGRNAGTFGYGHIVYDTPDCRSTL